VCSFPPPIPPAALPQATGLTYSLAGNDTCLGAGNIALSGVVANETAFGQVRAMAWWGTSGLFVSTISDHRIRLVNITTGRVSGCGRVGRWAVGW
jgi:hypothetical protein